MFEGKMSLDQNLLFWSLISVQVQSKNEIPGFGG